MKTTLKQYSVDEICKGFVYNELEGKGLYGLAGNLVIQPEYQRHYIYGDGKKDVAVVDSLLKGYPLGLIYFSAAKDANGADVLEVLDGQQRITSIGRFLTGKFAIKDGHGKEQVFSSLPPEDQALLRESTLLVYICDGTETEIKQWFETINIAGVPLNKQELLNAIYAGPFVTAAKREYSNSNNALMQKWQAYVKGDPKRQEILAEALSWVASSQGKTVDAYLAQHRSDTDIAELKTYFTSVVDWISSVFTRPPDKEMRGLEWGRLYEDYHDTAYDAEKIDETVSALRADEAVNRPRGIYEYVLGGQKDTKLLEIRLFDANQRRVAYEKQTKDAKAKGVSNCPVCAGGSGNNSTRIWKLTEMDADHVTAWSKGGKTDPSNLTMLCKTDNSAKGNR